LEAIRGLGGEERRDVREVLVAQRVDDGLHDRVVSLLGLEHRQLFADVRGVLAREIRPFRVHAIAVHAVAGHAYCGLAGAGFGRGGSSRSSGSGLFGDRDIGQAQAGAQQRGSELHEKSALNHGLAGSLEGGGLYTSLRPGRATALYLMSLFPKAHFLLSVAHFEQFPADFGTEVAFAGRSNSGKSSAINAITARNGLARTSKTPGRTKLLNFFELAPDQRIIDLPGYGYAEARPEERAQWTALIDSLPSRESLAGLFLIVDIRRGITAQDEQLIEWAADA